MQNARVDPAAVDAAAVGFRLAPRINAAGRLGRPDAALELLLTTDADEAKRLADELETLNRDRQAVEDRILRAADRRGRVVARGEAAAPRLRDLGRGLARGRDRDRRLAPRRALQPSRRPDRRRRRRLEGLGPLAAGVRPARRARRLLRSTWSASAATAPPPGSRSSRPTWRRSRPRSPRTRTRCLADDDLAPVTRIDAIVPGSALTLGLATELERLAPFGLGNPDVTLLVPACETVQPGVVGEGKHLRFRIRQGGRDAGSAIAFGLGPQLDRVDAARAPRHRLPAEGEPLERHRLAAARRPPALRHARRLRGAARAASAMLWKAGEDAWTGDAREIFAELELAEGARRQLYESEAFRALLAGDLASSCRAPPSRPARSSARHGFGAGREPGATCGLVESDEEAGELDGLALAAAA